MFNSAQHCQINILLLNKIPLYPQAKWPPFSKLEFNDTIKKYNSSSTSEPNHLSWLHIKKLVSDNKYLINIVNITNTYVTLHYWSKYFKKFTSFVIPKPNKMSYDFPKVFYPIVLHNTLSKLIKKIISNRL